MKEPERHRRQPPAGQAGASPKPPPLGGPGGAEPPPPPLPTASPLPQATPLARSTKPQRDASGRGPTKVPRKPAWPRSAAKVLPPAPLAVAAEKPNPLEPEDIREAAIRSAPAWLVSLVVHTMLIIFLALMYITTEVPKSIGLDATFAETLGEQIDDDTFQTPSLDRLADEDPVLALDKLRADDPFARPPDIEPRLDGFLLADTLTAPSIGLALTGRERGMKEALLAKYGGTATTEAAVGRALEWLKRNQRRDGTWSLKGPYSSGAFDENKTAATAMALLAFQGAGHTHETGLYKEQVSSGWRALLKMQDQDGNFYQGSDDGQRLYSQAQATIAVCEIYGMTKSSMFKAPAQRAIDYAVRIQAQEGGWRYRPGVDSDTSVTGWFVMGLQSALMAGLDVPSPTLQRVSDYLDSVALDGGSFYKYQPIRQGFTPAMTAEALLCRQYLGWTQNDKRLLEGAEYLLDNPINDQQREQRDVYYWYYATQVLHHLEGNYWDRWNQAMRNTLPKSQVSNGAERGSWDPNGDRWGSHGGRLYTTCLSTYMLEVYYRHLPIYSYRLR